MKLTSLLYSFRQSEFIRYHRRWNVAAKVDPVHAHVHNNKTLEPLINTLTSHTLQTDKEVKIMFCNFQHSSFIFPCSHPPSFFCLDAVWKASCKRQKLGQDLWDETFASFPDFMKMFHLGINNLGLQHNPVPLYTWRGMACKTTTQSRYGCIHTIQAH